ncbi:hypothetical protein UT300019_22280 [Clostridium sp. CTA-19]
MVITTYFVPSNTKRIFKPSFAKKSKKAITQSSISITRGTDA